MFIILILWTIITAHTYYALENNIESVLVYQNVSKGITSVGLFVSTPFCHRENECPDLFSFLHEGSSCYWFVILSKEY